MTHTSINYIAKNCHVTNLPGSFFVVWSDQDNDILAIPGLGARLKSARLEAVDSWGDVLLDPLVYDDPNRLMPARIAEALTRSNGSLRGIYSEAGLSDSEIERRMEVNNKLLVNAANNARFERLSRSVGNGNRNMTGNWSSRIHGLMNSLFQGR